jgi:hypothetical protein
MRVRCKVRRKNRLMEGERPAIQLRALRDLRERILPVIAAYEKRGGAAALLAELGMPEHAEAAAVIQEMCSRTRKFLDLGEGKPLHRG